jgi:GTP-binding protein EngB required for normal cell division
MQMLQFLHYHTIPFTVTLTKADKLSRMKLKEHVRAIAADMYLGVSNLLATSAETGYGKVDVLNKIASVLETHALQAEMDAECVDDEDESEEE